MNPFRFPIFFYLILVSFVLSGTVFAQETPTPQETFIQDKMECHSIPTEIDGLEFEKSLKCITKDSICYVIRGVGLSCVPRNGKYSESLPNLNPSPKY
ncbi:hypothetical protein EHS15_18115 [Leptospira idonii]|uniref:DUF3551 domain-containing protein n=1 Tax=Leptospira idonii TaxID=1193500 RepID=A0A4R9LTN7_9LEPT|nr:hypothetical protein EHS15_18115 [Leptospira idonii]